MTPKKRLSLNENSDLASEFVYGSTATPSSTESLTRETEPLPQAYQPEPDVKPSLREMLMPTAEKESTVRLTVDLPQSLHRQLSMLSAQTGKTKADIVRFLIKEALSQFDS